MHHSSRVYRDERLAHDERLQACEAAADRALLPRKRPRPLASSTLRLLVLVLVLVAAMPMLIRWPGAPQRSVEAPTGDQLQAGPPSPQPRTPTAQLVVDGGTTALHPAQPADAHAAEPSSVDSTDGGAAPTGARAGFEGKAGARSLGAVGRRPGALLPPHSAAGDCYRPYDRRGEGVAFARCGRSA
jgi:hypothetical protein